jgi:type III secretory pathway component EscV
MTTHHPQKKKGGMPLLQLALGAALAAGAGFYFTHKEDVDKEAKKQIEKFAKMFHEKKAVVEKKVKEVWGETSKEAVAVYMDLRSQLLKELEEENLKKRGQMLKTQYEKVVDEVVRRARKSELLTPEMEEKLGDIFKMDWTQVQKMLVTMVKNMKVARKVKAVRKTVTKAAKATKKAPAKKVKKPVRKPAKRK